MFGLFVFLGLLQLSFCFTPICLNRTVTYKGNLINSYLPWKQMANASSLDLNSTILTSTEKETYNFFLNHLLNLTKLTSEDWIRIKLRIRNRDLVLRVKKSLNSSKKSKINQMFDFAEKLVSMFENNNNSFVNETKMKEQMNFIQYEYGYHFAINDSSILTKLNISKLISIYNSHGIWRTSYKIYYPMFVDSNHECESRDGELIPFYKKLVDEEILKTARNTDKNFVHSSITFSNNLEGVCEQEFQINRKCEMNCKLGYTCVPLKDEEFECVYLKCSKEYYEKNGVCFKKNSVKKDSYKILSVFMNVARCFKSHPNRLIYNFTEVVNPKKAEFKITNFSQSFVDEDNFELSENEPFNLRLVKPINQKINFLIGVIFTYQNNNLTETYRKAYYLHIFIR